MSGFLEFIVAGLKKPLQVSTIFPTGDRVAEKLVSTLDPEKPGFVVELGVGSGAITQFIQPRLIDPSHYLGFEINPDLFAYVKKTYPKFRFVDDSAVNLPQYVGPASVRYVVSTLPWTLLPSQVDEAIVLAIHQALDEQGVFSTYLAANVLWTDAASRFQSILKKTFKRVEIQMELLNIPPARVFICRK